MTQGFPAFMSCVKAAPLSREAAPLIRRAAPLSLELPQSLGLEHSMIDDSGRNPLLSRGLCENKSYTKLAENPG
jgi:hypothetical protein